MKIASLPTLEELLSTTYPAYPFDKSLETSGQDIACIVHTSGSTGFPQPRRLKHGYFARAARNIRLEAPKGFQMLSNMIGSNRNALLLPLAHPAGIYFGLLNSLFNRSTVVIPLPSAPPTGQTLTEMLKHTTADWATTAPLTLETIAKSPALLDELVSQLKMLLYSGGSLPKVFGDIITQKIKLGTLLGSSESGPLPTMYPDGFDFKNDWSFMQLHPAVGPVFEMQRSHVYELVMKRSPENDPHQTVFTIFPDLKEYRTKDLFSPHPSLPNVWTHASRSDDVIVFITGEKFNPITYESHIAKNSDVEVAAVLMFGNQRFEAGLLIELADQMKTSAIERARIIDLLWPTIERVNALAPAYAKVSKSHIRFTDPGKPIMRTAKGTIRRQITLEQYAPQIEKLYRDVEDAWTLPAPRWNLDLSDVDSLKNAIRECLDSKFRETEEQADLFGQGMDSLEVLRLVRSLKQKTNFGDIEPSMVYLNPSISGLAQAIRNVSNMTQATEAEKKDQRAKEVLEALQALQEDVDELVGQVEPVSKDVATVEKHTVILTGSTGSIGSYILRSLLNSPRVEHIYCLNRSEDSEALQKERNAIVDGSLPQEFSKDKVTFLHVDLSAAGTLGLEDTNYELLQQKATLVIHNAWPVDFNLPLTSFMPNLAGVANLIAMSAKSILKPTIIFLSSISSVINSSPATAIPETVSLDLSAPISGYGESKYIAERLLSHASEKHGLRTGIVRIGQVCGAVGSQGRWNAAEWIPSLVLSSIYLGVIPDSLGVGDIDWLPIDVLSEVVLDIALHKSQSADAKTARVYQPINPKRTSWTSLLPSVTEALNDSPKPFSEPMRMVKPEEWLAKLRGSAAEMGTKEDIRANPALKLTDFFAARFSKEGGAPLEWENGRAMAGSKSLRDAAGVDGDLMARWVKLWCREDA